MAAPAAGVADPVQTIVDAGGVSKDDSLLVVRWDWNEDGVEDYFITTESDRQLSNHGDVTWTVYLSNTSKKFDLAPEGLLAPVEAFRVLRLDDLGGKPAILTFGPHSDETTIEANYLDEAGHIAQKAVAQLKSERSAANEADRKAINAENEALIERYINAAKTLEHVTTPAADHWPAGGTEHEPPPPLSEEPGYKYNLATDPQDPQRNLAYDKVTGEFVGYVVGKKFLNVSEAAARGLPTKRDVVAERHEIEAKERQQITTKNRLRVLVPLSIVAIAVLIWVVLARRRAARSR